ncbi:MAG: 1,4-alpha-glucan branching protein GlgB [Salinisphaera sp.]|jgi:1,4-alpha-glucan branching enzyme|nr:1,4-alpha-glucan branching protein GlgB [Salinisphaera sp.]
MTTPQLDDRHIQALVSGRHSDPFAVLGPHHDSRGEWIVRAFYPDAQAIEVIAADNGATIAAMTSIHADGVFEATAPSTFDAAGYRLRVEWRDSTLEFDDPYRFATSLSDLDIWLLAEGSHHRPYEQLGAHVMACHGVAGTRFAVWAPNAERVSVVGDFNLWDGRRHPMRYHIGCGVWELFIPGIKPGERYQYELLGAHGELLPMKADPYGFAATLRPSRASIVAEPPTAAPALGKTRQQANQRNAPISIYEVHLGSWRRAGDHGEHYLRYADIADALVSYVQHMGFTHVEFLPVSEYPFDGSWGYQPVGLYAPTSRFGSPEDFRALVQRCHDAGIGVILDWVPGHFPSDDHGLGWFDGTHLYEHADPRQGFHRDWNTLIFNYGRAEVCNYLVGNALFWLERYGVDGLRVDAVASMLYLDYSREGSDWVPNEHGGRENLEAVAFLRQLNERVGIERPGAMMIAEESTAWPQVTQPPGQGGLGFHYKWNLGWMNDSLEYIKHDPAHRRYHHDGLTFSLVYAFDENFLLPLSHDEVVHGKGSILARMPGDDWQRFANLRAYYGFMYTHPGKKLLFMGNEFAQIDEWSHERSIDWHLLDQPEHAGIQALVRDLNHCYRQTPALHECDNERAGFQWIDYNDAEQSVIAFIRRGASASSHVLCISNFTPVVRENYRIGIPADDVSHYRELLNTDAQAYGGSGKVIGPQADITVESVHAHGFEQSLTLTLGPLATVILQPV